MIFSHSMKFRFSSIVFLLLGAAFVLCAGAALTTHGRGYVRMRAESDEDSSLVGSVNLDWSNRPSGIHRVIYTGRDGDMEANAVHIIAIAGQDSDADPVNRTFSWKLYVWKDEWCPAEIVAEGTAVVGATQAVKFPDDNSLATVQRNYVDTWTITSQYFISTVFVPTMKSDGIAKIVFDLAGYKYIYMEITDADGSTGVEAGAVSVFYGWY